ncbi:MULTISPECIES: hypothetical protein [Streptomycetaceae]|uniref:Uncharacterized protein n=1 Tax=Streptantibioticus cattleyicolor (strain ATCC 35852 / DSM 46488 / JCM 4925 / NBRC 14057 / NRRL 8057) TaxID=1003195 RepID=F8JT20_STREN|nr:MULTISPECIES: hypothetical protein [Streptomycetaceae]AEW92955.1 hypothetical protein SCATT_05840 [Streptantibioticus cattleyicolor NRRL 8057 = DSM 46488]MYS57702.1 hypothetical protein [Streptomyces sp. SID5468]CCB73316.1 protein of unknown function [Streptantibioticus cattleyicolor NRRL 8057 = DSM 46488]
MSHILDELHTVIAHLEDEGHALAGRLRAVAARLRADIDHVSAGSETALETLVESLTEAVRPEFDRLKTEAVSEVGRLLATVLNAVEPVFAGPGTDAKQALADAIKAVRGLFDTPLALGQKPASAGPVRPTD